MKMATYTLEHEELRYVYAVLDSFGRKVRFGWLRNWLHRMAHRCGPKTHNWLIALRWYRWWGKQVYGPSLVEEMAEKLNHQIDEDILNAIYHGTTKPSDTDHRGP